MNNILNSLKDKAAALWGNKNTILNRATPIYDASRNKIFVAGLELDGVVNAMLSPRTRTRVEQGIDEGYYAYYDAQEPQTFAVETLPTAACNEVLELLAMRQKKEGGWFHLTIYENGALKELMRAHIISTSDIHLTQEPNNKSFVFGVVVVTPNVVMNNQNSDDDFQTPVAIEIQDAVDSQSVSESTPVQPQYVDTSYVPEKGADF